MEIITHSKHTALVPSYLPKEKYVFKIWENSPKIDSKAEQASIWSNRTKSSNNEYSLFHHPSKLKDINFPITYYELKVDEHSCPFLASHIQKQSQKGEQKA